MVKNKRKGLWGELFHLICAFVSEILQSCFGSLSIGLSFAQSLPYIGVKIHHLKVRFRIALGAGKMDAALGAGRDKGLRAGLDGFLDALDLN